MKENKKELIKLISKIAVALAVFVFVLINYKELVNIIFPITPDVIVKYAALVTVTTDLSFPYNLAKNV